MQKVFEHCCPLKKMVCVYLMSYYSQYMENIRIMADSSVLSTEIIIGIPIERTTLSAMTRMFSIY